MGFSHRLAIEILGIDADLDRVALDILPGIRRQLHLEVRLAILLDFEGLPVAFAGQLKLQGIVAQPGLLGQAERAIQAAKGVGAGLQGLQDVIPPVPQAHFHRRTGRDQAVTGIIILAHDGLEIHRLPRAIDRPVGIGIDFVLRQVRQPVGIIIHPPIPGPLRVLPPDTARPGHGNIVSGRGLRAGDQQVGVRAGGEGQLEKAIFVGAAAGQLVSLIIIDAHLGRLAIGAAVDIAQPGA